MINESKEIQEAHATLASEAQELVINSTYFINLANGRQDPLNSSAY